MSMNTSQNSQRVQPKSMFPSYFTLIELLSYCHYRHPRQLLLPAEQLRETKTMSCISNLRQSAGRRSCMEWIMTIFAANGNLRG